MDDCLSLAKRLSLLNMSSEPPSTGRRARSQRPSFDPELLFSDTSTRTPTTLYRAVRCVYRLVGIFVWGLLCTPVQILFMKLPGWLHVRLPIVFWKGVARLLGLKVRVVGETPSGKTPGQKKRPILYVANHTSWLDIITLGSTVPTLFISKQEVRDWPVIGLLTHLGSALFSSRNRQDMDREIQEVLKRLREGHNVTLFPEGTSSAGATVEPFLSSFFSIAKPVRRSNDDDAPAHPLPLVQPISITYDRLEGLPTGRNRRISVFSWFGDMELLPHLWGLGQWRSLQVTVHLHPPLDPADFPSRKNLAAAAHAIIRRGNEDLNQHRPPLV